jgi:hypothetical protein
VQSPEAATSADDQRIEARGAFTASPFDVWQPPLLVVAAIQPVETPNQPYLYP